MKKKEPILGVDIGASKIHIIVWNGKKVLERCHIKEVTPKKLKEIVSAFGLKRVRVGIPGILDFKTGKILECPNLPSFNGLYLKKFFPDLEIKVDNDAKCFLLAETTLGAARGYKNVLGITFGTGIGGAILINNKIYRGSKGSAGEFGHMLFDQGKTWEQLYQKNKGNPEEQERLNVQGIANLINIFNPEIIVLGGGAAKIPQRALIEKHILSPLAKKTKIVLSKLGEDASAVGAALLH